MPLFGPDPPSLTFSNEILLGLETVVPIDASPAAKLLGEAKISLSLKPDIK